LAVNTALVERHNATDRNRNAGKARKMYCFSKDWWIHRAVTFFTMYRDNFCWPIWSPRRRPKSPSRKGPCLGRRVHRPSDLQGGDAVRTPTAGIIGVK